MSKRAQRARTLPATTRRSRVGVPHDSVVDQERGGPLSVRLRRGGHATRLDLEALPLVVGRICVPEPPLLVYRSIHRSAVPLHPSGGLYEEIGRKAGGTGEGNPYPITTSSVAFVARWISRVGDDKRVGWSEAWRADPPRERSWQRCRLRRLGARARWRGAHVWIGWLVGLVGRMCGCGAGWSHSSVVVYIIGLIDSRDMIHLVVVNEI